MPQVAKFSSFEGLFVHTLNASEALKERLKSAGVDLNRPEPSYPFEVWVRCLQLAAEETYPGQPAELAHRLLGHRIVDGYLQTLVGKVIGVTLPMLSPKRMIARIPLFFSSGVSGFEHKVTHTAENEAVVDMLGYPALATNFGAGIIEEGFKRVGAKSYEVDVVTVAPGHFALRAYWTE